MRRLMSCFNLDAIDDHFTFDLLLRFYASVVDLRPVLECLTEPSQPICCGSDLATECHTEAKVKECQLFIQLIEPSCQVFEPDLSRSSIHPRKTEDERPGLRR